MNLAIRDPCYVDQKKNTSMSDMRSNAASSCVAQENQSPNAG